MMRAFVLLTGSFVLGMLFLIAIAMLDDRRSRWSHQL